MEVDWNWIRTHNHLVRKRTLNQLAKLACLAKWLSVRLWTKWLWVRFQLQSHWRADLFTKSFVTMAFAFLSTIVDLCCTFAAWATLCSNYNTTTSFSFFEKTDKGVPVCKRTRFNIFYNGQRKEWHGLGRA